MAPASLLVGLIELAIRHRLALLLLAAVLAAVCWPVSRQLAFDRSIEKMFAPSDPLLPPYRKLKQVFGGNEVVLAAYVDPDQAGPAGRARLRNLTGAIRPLPGVETALSLDDVPRTRRMEELFEGYTIGADRQTLAVVVLLDPEADDAVKTETVAEIRRLVRAAGDSGVVAGEPVMVLEGFRMVEQDGRRLRVWSLLLVSLTVLLLFRSLRWLLIPLAVVQLTLLMTEALLAVSRLELSMVSSMLAAIVTVVGVATVVHIIVRFRVGRADGLEPRQALSRALRQLAVPIALACLTDAVAFSALLLARVGPIQDFGLMMALGSLLVLVAVVLLVPGMTLAFGRFDADPRRAWGEGALDHGLRHVADGVLRRPWTLGAAGLLLAAGSIYGCRFLEVETDFTRNFRADSDIVRSYQLIESQLGGAGVWDVLIPLPPQAEGRLDQPFIDRLQRYQRRLRREVVVPDADGADRPGLTKVLSVADGLEAFPLPGISRLLSVERRLDMLDRITPGIVPMLRGSLEAEPAPPRHYVRVMLRARERQSSDDKRAIIAQVRRITGEEFPDAEVTGFYVLLANLIDSILQDQWRCFAAAGAGILLMMLLALRSLRLAVIALVPNAVPILIVMGWLGWLGIRVNMGTAMIAAVSIGLSVDSSIHYLWAYRRALADGRGVRQAIHDTHQLVGRAMFFSSLALIVGFCSLCLSDFIPTIYFGALVSLAMLGGLVGNLVALPLLLSITPGKE